MTASPADQTLGVGAPKTERVSVIVPMFNEAAHIEHFVADVAAQDFPGEVELIVADGASTDGSADLLRAAASAAGLDAKVIPNPARWVSQGLNACIREARGDLLVRLDCHSRYPSDYLRLCAGAADDESDAIAVGGIVIPQGRTDTERAVAAAMDSPFGGIGWMRATNEVRRESDVLTYGAFRPEAFQRAGLFDETLLRNQDDEFTLRLRRAGGRLVLDSRIRVYYTPRGSYRAVMRQYFQYGFWKVRVMRKHRQVLSARSLVPPLFVGSLLLLLAGSFFFAAARVALLVDLATYVAGGTVFGIRSLRSRGEPLRLLPRVLAVYPAFHVAYGAGLLWGLLRARSGPEPEPHRATLPRTANDLSRTATDGRRAPSDVGAVSGIELEPVELTAPTDARAPVSAFTVDVEDWYQSSIDFDAPITERVIRNTDRLLELLDEAGVKGTFFVQGKVAETFPRFVASLAEQGHEVQAHGYSHRPLHAMSAAQLRSEIERAKKTVEDASGTPVTAFRAQDFSVLSANLWALETLADVGFTVDSSIFPMRSRHYGIPGWQVAPHRVRFNGGGSLLEVPVAVWGTGRWRFPVAGGGYFRLLPKAFLLRALKSIAEERPAVVYCHPYEFNSSELGEYRGRVSAARRYSQSLGRGSYVERTRMLLERLRFGRFDEVLAAWGLR